MAQRQQNLLDTFGSSLRLGIAMKDNSWCPSGGIVDDLDVLHGGRGTLRGDTKRLEDGLLADPPSSVR